jgi:thymidine kinase
MAALYFHYATMNAGKSAELISNNYNYVERSMRTLVLKPSVDTREENAVVKSRNGNIVECGLFSPEEDLFELIKGNVEEFGFLHVVFIDEAQFMTPGQVHELAQVVDELEIPVMTYGLRTDFQGNLFPGSAALFALANKLVQIRTICWCSRLANMVLRLDNTGKVIKVGDQIQVGGNDSYVAVCRKHFFSEKISSD